MDREIKLTAPWTRIPLITRRQRVYIVNPNIYGSEPVELKSPEELRAFELETVERGSPNELPFYDRLIGTLSHPSPPKST